MTVKPIGMNTRLTRNQAIVSSKVDNEVIMMSVENSEYYCINPMGSRIWELLDTPGSISSLCSTLVKEYDVSIDACQREVREFVERLIEKKLVHPV